MRPYNPQCEECHKFMSYEQMGTEVTYTPFGGYLDFEPPDPRFIHRACWELREERWKDLTRRIAWRGPYDQTAKAKV